MAISHEELECATAENNLLCEMWALTVESAGVVMNVSMEHGCTACAADFGNHIGHYCCSLGSSEPKVGVKAENKNIGRSAGKAASWRVRPTH